jgi:hypothetical protein
VSRITSGDIRRLAEAGGGLLDVGVIRRDATLFESERAQKVVSAWVLGRLTSPTPPPLFCFGCDTEIQNATDAGALVYFMPDGTELNEFIVSPLCARCAAGDLKELVRQRLPQLWEGIRLIDPVLVPNGRGRA